MRCFAYYPVETTYRMALSDNPSFELQALLDATVGAVIVIDAGGVVEVFNHSAERMFGYSATEAVGQNVRMLMTGRDRQHHDAYLER